MPVAEELESLFASPVNGGAAVHRDASGDELEALEALGQHFGETNYKLPISVDADAATTGLSEREMMFLVSFPDQSQLRSQS